MRATARPNIADARPPRNQRASLPNSLVECAWDIPLWITAAYRPSAAIAIPAAFRTQAPKFPTSGGSHIDPGTKPKPDQGQDDADRADHGCRGKQGEAAGARASRRRGRRCPAQRETRQQQPAHRLLSFSLEIEGVAPWPRHDQRCDYRSPVARARGGPQHRTSPPAIKPRRGPPPLRRARSARTRRRWCTPRKRLRTA